VAGKPCREGRYLERKPDSLVSRLKAGNRAAAAELVDIYHEQIYMFMRRLGHSRQVSEDLTQESFIQAWQNIGQLKSGDEALNRWMYSIAGNVSKQYWRSHKSKDELSIEGIEIDVRDSSKAGCDKMEHLERLKRLSDAVVKLPIKLRQAVILHYMQHMTIGQAAEAMGVRKGTFKSRLNRALKSLRKKFI
jgi:RNA polymerase sigma-70 factor (ECF subfamily)